jgi:hypothetical protein
LENPRNFAIAVAGKRCFGFAVEDLISAKLPESLRWNVGM